jgi:hypothetical protein
MDTEKLFKAIQIVVKEEVKKQLSTIKEEVRKELLSEIKGNITTKQKSSTKSLKDIVEESSDPFELANKILANDRVEQKQYSKNPMINNILNETAIRPNFSRTDGEYGTITPEMVGYGNPKTGFQSPSTKELPSTGNDLIDAAIARSAKVLAASKNKQR